MIDYAVIVAIIVGLTEIIKRYLPSKFMPIVSLILGIVAGLFYVEGDLKMQIFVGIAMGLAASGLFDVAQIGKKNGNLE
ncbi:hypothetical protein [Bacillus andreraoultii]|uniref:hypothetical protein n=1 Tax=Bacillus andreraoultii TaxID=1499685 RepID=UPI000539C47E|nr:hypothetical protein [Bacillus andreraoultii]